MVNETGETNTGTNTPSSKLRHKTSLQKKLYELLISSNYIESVKNIISNIKDITTNENFDFGDDKFEIQLTNLEKKLEEILEKCLDPATIYKELLHEINIVKRNLKYEINDIKDVYLKPSNVSKEMKNKIEENLKNLYSKYMELSEKLKGIDKDHGIRLNYNLFELVSGNYISNVSGLILGDDFAEIISKIDDKGTTTKVSIFSKDGKLHIYNKSGGKKVIKFNKLEYFEIKDGMKLKISDNIEHIVDKGDNTIGIKFKDYDRIYYFNLDEKGIYVNKGPSRKRIEKTGSLKKNPDKKE